MGIGGFRGGRVRVRAKPLTLKVFHVVQETRRRRSYTRRLALQDGSRVLEDLVRRARLPRREFFGVEVARHAVAECALFADAPLRRPRVLF